MIRSRQALSLKRLDILKIHREVFHRQRVQTLPMEKVFLAFTAGASQSLFPVGETDRTTSTLLPQMLQRWILLFASTLAPTSVFDFFSAIFKPPFYSEKSILAITKLFLPRLSSTQFPYL
jgi:hypothetical protein